jgi:spore germination protein GerM
MSQRNRFSLVKKARRDPMIDIAPSARKRLFLGYLGALLIGCVAILPFQNLDAETESNSHDAGQLNSELQKLSHKFPAHLYFADRNHSFLKSEPRVMHQSNDPVEFGRAIVEALIKGPQKGLVRTIPAGTELSAIYIDPDNVCYVDLSESVTKKHPGGTNSELLTIYSVVNSLILNVSEIKQVKILIEGNEAPTLAGHINLQFPFKAHMLLIR